MVIIDFFKAIFQDIGTFFSTDLNFGGPLTTGNIIVWAIILGFAVSAFVCLYNRVFLGRFVSYLIKSGATSEETALSLSQSKISNIFVRSALKSKGLFTKIVHSDQTDKNNILNCRFYIPSENIPRAQRLYSKNGASPFTIIISLILLIVIAAIVYVALPELIQMAENFGIMIKS